MNEVVNIKHTIAITNRVHEQWGNGGLKPDKFIHKKDVGLYKVYWDSRLSSSSAQKLVPYLQTAAYLDEFTSTIEVEMITYNPEFAVFGGNILWDYQYDTVLSFHFF